MKEKIEKRLQQLKMEYQTGQEALQDLQQKQLSLEQTLLRISGAIQVLEELQATEKQVNKIQASTNHIQ